MTLRDPEVIELLRDDPELLALADALAETQRLPSRRTRRFAPRVAAIAAVAAGIVIAVLLFPGGGGNNPVLGRALAAIGNGRVLHLVLEAQTGEILVNLGTGHRTVVTVRFESWTDRDFKRDHLVMRMRGQVADVLLPEDAAALGGSGALGPIDPAYVAFWTGYRRALANGDAKLEGDDTIAGRPVYWLQFPSIEHGLPGTEVAIDQRTYKPVVLRHHTSGNGYRDARVLVAETTAYRASDFKRLGPNMFDSGSASASSGSVRTGSANSPIGAPWLTPGKRLGDLVLQQVDHTTTTARGKKIEGLDLLYRKTPSSGASSPGSLMIHELARPDDPLLWKHIPRGFISIEKGAIRTGPRTTYPTWTGYLVKHGIYITIDTGAGENAVLEAARALHPA
jgi:hypothetical protein